MARITPLAANSWTAANRWTAHSRWDHTQVANPWMDLAALTAAGLIVAVVFAATVLTFGPVLLAVLRSTDRQIDRWVQQDAPRPQEADRG